MAGGERCTNQRCSPAPLFPMGEVFGHRWQGVCLGKAISVPTTYASPGVTGIMSLFWQWPRSLQTDRIPTEDAKVNTDLWWDCPSRETAKRLWSKRTVARASPSTEARETCLDAQVPPAGTRENKRRFPAVKCPATRKPTEAKQKVFVAQISTLTLLLKDPCKDN